MAITEILNNYDVVSVHFIASSLITELASQSATVAIAEGCSGGRVLNSLTIPGSTRVFRLGCVAYSREAKLRLGVPEDLINRHGEYSLEVAIAMAKAVRRFRNDALAMATVGDIDPNNSDTLPVVHFGFARNDGSFWGQTIFLGTRGRNDTKGYIANLGLSKALMFARNQQIQEIKHNNINLPELPNSSYPLDDRSRNIFSCLASQGLKIATMESCTGGAVADEITNISGASQVLDSCWVTYDENSKALLGVPLLAMANGSVYSERVAISMAEAVLQKTGVDVAIGTTGAMDTIDRRPFHSDTQPGTVYIAVVNKRKTLVRKLNIIPSNRDVMKQEIVSEVFKLLEQLLQTQEVTIFPSQLGLSESKF